METKADIFPLLHLVVAQFNAQSKRYFETAAVEFASEGRGAYVVPLQKAHLDGEQGYGSFYMNQKKLETYNIQSVMDHVANYDPTRTFVLWVIYKKLDGYQCSIATFIDADAHLKAPQSGLTVARPRTINSERCNYCTTTSNLLRCARCKCAAYCSKHCQKRDWPDHKRDCTALKTWIQ